MTTPNGHRVPMSKRFGIIRTMTKREAINQAKPPTHESVPMAAEGLAKRVDPDYRGGRREGARRRRKQP